MFYLDGQQKLKEMKDLSVDELETSQITVNSPTTTSTNSTVNTHNGKFRRRKR